ncbi:Stp1/IreP family PP2C-type Ser/Thr phosphatase [Chakrabartyella piscis]|uniref:Stp1/IreP family PP2C-type Ser/Thr phosphatase n=1 Tax=Chakrabartyella piscis TaxID=2918914 RepID=UPI0029584E7A|nr:Stp1/IreP family PP2C-type Ser/Thr phosphatase [Chakrabartyella piscis]
MRAVGISDVGKHRKNNEDAIFVPTDTDEIQNLFLIADGMGGCNAGEIASNLAIEAFLKFVKKEGHQYTEEDVLDLLVGGIVACNKRVYEVANTERNFADMGTTIVAATVQQKKAYIAYVGDSRAYLFHKKELIPLTVDHSYVMELVKAGKITEEEARIHPKRNEITRAIGMGNFVEVDTYIQEMIKGDLLLLCTDGLTGMLEDKEMEEILGKRISLEKKVQKLIDAANDRGGYDNVSLILIDVGGKG